MPNFSPLSKTWKDAMRYNSAFTPLEVRTHYRGTYGPKQSLTISEAPLWNVSNNWQRIGEFEKLETDSYSLHRRIYK